ncbi:sensor histidine kinase [Aquisediminimonas profunda]|uniref:sensor histidine kinase n=1 Tax=Aquisediminimonas profunda TaxID=1550733 RepID=UPI001C631406|nr:histidine kinase [Aquisediminimonas profunda]
MNESRELPESRPLDSRAVLFSILGFWLFYVIIVTLRAMIMDFPAQGEMALRRGFVTGVGIFITIGLWLILRLLDRKPFWTRVVAVSLMSVPCAVAISAVNYYFFNVYDPAGLMDIERAFPDKDHPVIMEIAEVAISRYFFLIAWASLYLALGFSQDVREAERRTARFARAAQSAELRALRYQVNPHFLFNTLNSLSALVMRGRRDEAETMIMNLSTFYRTSLSGEPSEDVELAEEIELQKLYLDIEAVRFPERLQVKIDLPPDLASAAVPGLILQPLVENAIKHGVSQTNRPVLIEISAAQADGQLILTVSDDGPGPTKGMQPDDGPRGIGLANVRDRLAARFGDRASIVHGPNADGGYRVCLTLPLVRHAG